MGRDDELRVLADALGAAAAGAGRLVLVEGAAGVGKTRLVEATGVLARERGFRLLRARGVALEADLSFGVVRQLYERLLVGMSSAERDDVLSGAAQLARPLVDGGLTADAPAADAHGLLHGLYWLTANLARRRPVLLVVDDLHWADASSGRWLDYLAHRLDGLPVGLVLAQRPTQTVAWWPGSAPGTPGRDVEGVDHLVLHGLDPASVAVLVRRALGVRATPEVVEACVTQTGGNPFLLHELLDALPGGPLGVTAVRECGPARLGRAVAARTAAAGPTAVALADAVAVLGDGVELRLAARLAGLRVAEAELAADALEHAGVLAPGRPVAFAHAIVRQALQRRRPAGERALAHATAARLLAREGAPDEQVAAHVLRAGPAGSTWAVDRLRAAARRALEHGAPDSAVTYLRRALREPPRQRYKVLLELGRAEARIHHPEARVHLEPVVGGARRPEDRATAALELARLLLASGEPSRATDVLDRAVRGLGTAHPELSLTLECERMAAAMGSLSRAAGAVERFESAHASSPPFGPPLIRLVMAQRAMGRLAIGEDRDGTLELARGALAGGRLLAEQGCEAPGYYFACNAVAGCDELAEGGTALAAAVEVAQRQGSRHGYAFASSWRAWALLRAGDVRGAELDASSVVEPEDEVGQGFNQTVAASVLAEALIERDDPAAARTRLTRAWAECASDQVTNLYLHFVDARLRLLTGDPAGALREALAVGQRTRAAGYVFPSLLPWRSVGASAHRALGQDEEAAVLVAEEVGLTRRFGAPRALGIALRTQALVGRAAERVDVLRQAVSVLESSQARLAHAQALLDLGTALRRAGHRAEARGPLGEALELATRCGGVWVARRAREELVAAGARPRRPAQHGPDALTPAELRVARCAAQGMTTREVAQSLFLTTKTVETHLTRTYRKLRVASRTELPAALDRTTTG
ncbi:regulatory protein, luxR family [Geodermatophilus telluris]|uniref:Regulatory protein, luxR family n=1 Tax=Geodermatophilus telluris TaxID=1190417 RepID=A0A1G6S7V8_9ACTN|nr:AAA family ATPase [Geodermatophilus telluris]SDD12803.1 regulatory protein, luxR family [Geodermatophilus telluris]